jgi:transposase
MRSPGGYELHRLLTPMGVACDVVAPSLLPKGTLDRVKTDKRNSVRLALTHRAGLLTAIRVPSAAEEAVRDLSRARGNCCAPAMFTVTSPVTRLSRGCWAAGR